MPGFPVTSIPDLIEATTEHFSPMKLTDISNTTQHFRAFNRLLRVNQVAYSGGTKIRVPLLTERTNTSRWTSLYEDDPTVGQVSGLTHGNVEWRFGDFRWAYDEREVLVNAGEAQIQDYIKVKRLQALNDWANFFESWFWGTPPTSSDVTTPFPLKYWLTKDVTTAGAFGNTAAGAGSFSGGAPTGHSTVAEINPSTYTQWKNFTYKYTDITDDDALDRWETALRAVNFEPPTGAMYPSPNTGNQYEHFMSLETLKAYERLAKRQNENLGYDLGAREPMYYRAPMVWVPQIDSDTDQPIYSINWGWFKTMIRSGNWMKERRAIQSPKCEYVWITTTSNVLNIVNFNRRAHAVGAMAAANP